MPGSFTLEIVTPDGMLYSGDVSYLQAPAMDGLFGVLSNRAPLLSALGAGVLTFTDSADNKTRVVAVGGGFCEVATNHVVVLADDAAFGENIDPKLAQKDVDATSSALATGTRSEHELEQRRKAYSVANARLTAALKCQGHEKSGH